MSIEVNNISYVESIAPASTANFCVGFDFIGASIANIHDTVILERRSDNLLRLIEVSGDESSIRVPLVIEENITTAVLLKLKNDLNISIGFNVRLKKGIPLSSGLGGSAASSVAAVIAFNEFLETKLTLIQIIKYALYGESIASSTMHADNILPSLLGGFILINSIEHLKYTRLPHLNMHLVIMHPEIEIKTRDARNLLKEPFHLKDLTLAQQNLSSVIIALYTNDIVLLRHHMRDELIEPRRRRLIPYFDEVQSSALNAGAIGCSISGAGPAIFSLVIENDVTMVANAMKSIYIKKNLKFSIFKTSLCAPGAMIKTME